MSVPTTALYTGRIYPGLRPFDTEDSLLFFGRDPQTDELLRRLDDTRFLAVVGLSGSGKSSLVRAGLLPALRRGHLSGAGSQWRFSVMRPGSDPLGALARALDETLGEREDRLQTLRSGSLGLLDASRYGRSADENLLLVVDQFEEIFRFQDTYRQRAREAADFVELLLDAYRDYEPLWRVFVVITLRSDYLGECARFPGLPEALNESQYLVPRMTREQLLREAIAGPAALGDVELDPELREELLDKTGDDPDQLPVLQHLLMRMWERREQTSTGFRVGKQQYMAVGGWENALNEHADAVWNELGARRDLAKRIFQRLTEKAQAGREVRRPATVRELAEVAEAPTAEVTAVVERFRQEGCNLLTSPDRELNPDSVVDISHESLIRRWKRLNEWTMEEAGWGEWYRRVEDTLSFRGAWLVDPAFESALEAREKGRWSAAWAERYAKKEGDKQSYGEVIAFLEESRKRRGAEKRLRRARAIVAMAAFLFAALALASTYFALSARQARRQAETKTQEAVEQRAKTEKALTAVQEQSQETQSALKEAEEQRRIALEQRRSAEEQRLISESRGLAATALLMKGVRSDLASLLSVESWKTLDTFEAKSALLSAVQWSPELTAYLYQNQAVTSVAFSPDGKMLASASPDKTVRLWDVATRRPLGEPLLGHTDSVFSVAFSPDGKTLASASEDRTVRLWDVATRRPLGEPLQGHTGGVRSVAFGPDGKTLASAGDDKTVRLWDVATRRPLGEPLQGQTDYILSVAFSPDGKTLAFADTYNTVRLWDVATRRPLGEPLLGHASFVYGVAFSPDGKTLASASDDTTVRLWDVATRRPLGEPLQGHTSFVRSVAFSPDGKALATASGDKTVRLWDVSARRPLGEPLRGHTDSVQSVAFSPDGNTLASASLDSTVRLWDVATRQPLGKPLLGHMSKVRSVAFSPDGKTLASGSDDETVRLWDVATRRPLGEPLQGHTSFVNSVAFSPDGRMLASASDDETVRLWDVATRRPLGEPLRGHTGAVNGVAFSPGGKMLASASDDKTVRLWDMATCRPLGEPLQGHTGGVNSVRFSPDGNTLASASDDKTVRLWDVATRRPLGEPLQGHTREVLSVAFSPDGRMLALASYDNTLRLWDVATRRPLGEPLPGTTASVNSVAFSRDGKTLASASDDSTVRLWEVDTRLPLGEPLLGHTAPVESVAFSPDGRTLASASADTTVRLWDVDPGSWISRICQSVNRNLSMAEWRQYVGDTVPYRRTCPAFPPGEGAPTSR